MKNKYPIYRLSILVDIYPGIRISAIHPIVSDDFCSFSNRMFLFSSVSVFESVKYICRNTYCQKSSSGKWLCIFYW